MKKIRIKQDQVSTELFSTMGCRTQNGADINALDSYKKNIQTVINSGYLYDNYISAAQKDGRGNICPVTIIMPTLAMEAKEQAEKNGTNSVNEFMAILAQAIEDARDILIERFEWICSQPMDAAKFMYENGTMEGYVPEEGIKSALKHGTLAIGQLGLAETLQILIGCDHTDKKGMDVAKQIEGLFKDLCAKYKEEYKLNFGVYFTPKILWGA